MRLLIAVSVLTVMSLGAAVASAQSQAHAAAGVCIEDKAKASFTCAAAARSLDASQARNAVTFHAVQPPVRPATATSTKPTTPEASEPRDDRKIRLEARQRAMLAVEVQRLE